MEFIRGGDWGGGALKDRGWVHGFTHSERFDRVNGPTFIGSGLVMPMFQAANDAYITVITKFGVEWANPLIGNVWKVGLRFGQSETADQARDFDGVHGDIANVDSQPGNGLVGPRLYDLLSWEPAYVVRPGRTVSLFFTPVQALDASSSVLNLLSSMPPEGTVYIAGGRLQ